MIDDQEIKIFPSPSQSGEIHRYFNGTYRSDNNIKLHQNLVGSDQKNIRFVADQSTLTVGPDHREGCPEIDLTFLTASRTLNH